MSLLIKGVQVVDGTGKEPYRADVLIQKDLISSIGNLKERGAKKVIEGFGNYLTPGFIDIQSRADHYLSIFSNPKQESLVGQGITTILGGADGASLAPLLYGSPDSINLWSDISEININWHTVEEFLSQLDERKLGINFGTLIGHSTLRRDLVGDRKLLDKKELVVLKHLIESSLDGGAFGVSSDLASVYGNAASSREVGEILNTISEQDAVYVIGLRNLGVGLLKSVEEIIKLAEGSNAKIVINNLRPTKGRAKEFKQALKALENASEKLDIYFLVQPYELSELPIYSFLPSSLQKTNVGTMLAKVRDDKNTKAIHEELKEIDFRNMRVASAPHHHFLVGKSVKQVADNWNISYIEAMHKIMKMSDLRATVFYEDASYSILRNCLGKNQAIITANATGVLSGGGYLENEAADSVFPNYLRSVVREGLLSLEGAVQKITAVPANLFKIGGRGLIEEGKIADLVLLSKDNYEVKQVILGGEVFQEDNLKGDILRYYG
ncbi:MAG: amidohydrolase family protein [Patescibacteria group bacterium]